MTCLDTTTFQIHVPVFGNHNGRRRPVVRTWNPQQHKQEGHSRRLWKNCEYHRTDLSWQKPAEFGNCDNRLPDWNNTKWAVGSTHQWCDRKTLLPNEFFASAHLFWMKEAFYDKTKIKAINNEQFHKNWSLPTKKSARETVLITEITAITKCVKFQRCPKCTKKILQTTCSRTAKYHKCSGRGNLPNPKPECRDRKSVV